MKKTKEKSLSDLTAEYLLAISIAFDRIALLIAADIDKKEEEKLAKRRNWDVEENS